MAYDGTIFTAIKLDDKDVNDPNSGFYTAQATTEQINSIPADAKFPVASIKVINSGTKLFIKPTKLCILPFII